MGKAINQTDAELATGLSREVLRKWEARFQFPLPARDERGRRVYTQADVARLQLIKELLDCGFRPRQLLSLSVAELRAMHPVAMPAAAHFRASDAGLAEALLATLASAMPPQALPRFLRNRLQHVGLEDFVHQDLPLFNKAVGEAWASGRLSVVGEHYFSACIDALVRTANARQQVRPDAPRVLLTTPPSELHSLGILALEAALGPQGALCIGLGTQSPAKQVVAAAQGWGVYVVAVSISEAYPKVRAQRYIQQLRRGLPGTCALWVGGAGIQIFDTQPPEGVQFFQSTREAVAAWKQLLAVRGKAVA